MQIRALRTFSYMAGHEKVRVPRGLSVDLPEDAAKAAIAAGEAVVAGEYHREKAPAFEKSLEAGADVKKSAGKGHG